MAKIKQVLELFGGLDSIETRMMKAIGQKLRERTKGAGDLAKAVREQKIPPETFLRFADPDILTIAEERGIKPEILWQIHEGSANVDVTFELFENLQWSLDLSIDDVLGDPNLSDDKTVGYWEEQRKDAPMLIAAKLSDGNSEETEQPNVIDLRLYVTLRATEELAWNTDI